MATKVDKRKDRAWVVVRGLAELAMGVGGRLEE